MKSERQIKLKMNELKKKFKFVKNKKGKFETKNVYAYGQYLLLRKVLEDGEWN